MNGIGQSMPDRFRTMGTIIGNSKGVLPYLVQSGKDTGGIGSYRNTIGIGNGIGKRTGAPCLGNGNLPTGIHRTIDQLDHLNGWYHFIV